MYYDDVRNSKQKCIKDCISNESLRRHIDVYVNYQNITNNNKLLVFFRLSMIALRDEIALSTRATVIIISSLAINFP